MITEVPTIQEGLPYSVIGEMMDRRRNIM